MQEPPGRKMQSTCKLRKVWKRGTGCVPVWTQWGQERECEMCVSWGRPEKECAGCLQVLQRGRGKMCLRKGKGGHGVCERRKVEKGDLSNRLTTFPAGLLFDLLVEIWQESCKWWSREHLLIQAGHQAHKLYVLDCRNTATAGTLRTSHMPLCSTSMYL